MRLTYRFVHSTTKLIISPEKNTLLHYFSLPVILYNVFRTCFTLKVVFMFQPLYYSIFSNVIQVILSHHFCTCTCPWHGGCVHLRCHTLLQAINIIFPEFPKVLINFAAALHVPFCENAPSNTFNRITRVVRYFLTSSQKHVGNNSRVRFRLIASNPHRKATKQILPTSLDTTQCCVLVLW